MMPVDYYPNKNLEELKAVLATLQNRQLKGAITEVSAAGVRTVRDLGMGAMTSRTETEIKRVLYSLHLRAADGDEADKWVNPYAGMIRRTRAHYSFS